MPEGFLDDPDVNLLVGKARGEGVPHAVRMHPLRDLSLSPESPEQAADVGRLQGLAVERGEHGARDPHAGLAFKPRRQDGPCLGIKGHGPILASLASADP